MKIHARPRLRETKTNMRQYKERIVVTVGNICTLPQLKFPSSKTRQVPKFWLIFRLSPSTKVTQNKVKCTNPQKFQAGRNHNYARLAKILSEKLPNTLQVATPELIATPFLWHRLQLQTGKRECLMDHLMVVLSGGEGDEASWSSRWYV